LILGRYRVPAAYHQPILMVGIILSLIFRLVFILLGAALLEAFTWVFFIFGAFLVWTAIQQARGGHEEEEETAESFLVRKLRRVMQISDRYEGAKLRTVVDGRRVWTPVIL